MHISLRSQVKDMYLQGYSIKYIVDYVYNHLNKNASYCYNEFTCKLVLNEYSKDYCRKCVCDTILEVNNSLKYIV